MNDSGSLNAMHAIAAVMQVGMFGGIGAGITYWLFDNATIGAIFAIGIYQALCMALIGGDIMEIRKKQRSEGE